MGYRPPTTEQQEEFLDLVRGGKTRQEAAEDVGCTSTQFKRFINGHSAESQAYAQRYLDALDASGNSPAPLARSVREAEQIHLAHRLFDETVMRALDAERGRSGSSNRVLYNLSLLNIESFKPLLEARVRHVHSGAVGLYAALPQIDTERWTLAEQEEFVALEARRAELLAKAAPEGQKSLPAASNGVEKPEVVDAEFEDVTAAG